MYCIVLSSKNPLKVQQPIVRQAELFISQFSYSAEPIVFTTRKQSLVWLFSKLLIYNLIIKIIINYLSKTWISSMSVQIESVLDTADLNLIFGIISGNISFVAFPVSSTNSPTKILPKTLGPINVNVGPQMVRKSSNLRI